MEMTASNSEPNSSECSNLISLQETEEGQVQVYLPFSLQDWPQLISPGTDSCFSELHSFITYHQIQHHPPLTVFHQRSFEVATHEFSTLFTLCHNYDLLPFWQLQNLSDLLWLWKMNNSSFSFLRPCLDFSRPNSQTKNIVLSEVGRPRAFMKINPIYKSESKYIPSQNLI